MRRLTSLRHQLEAAGCTRLEIEAAVLHDQGWGYRRIAIHQHAAITTVRDRIARAATRLTNHQHQEAE